ncbi:MAG: hypothetical protein DRO43_03170, partial [Candidatus Hecatellales archaeon]
LIVKHGVDHIPIVRGDGKLLGIVTSWDLAKALAEDKHTLQEVMTSRVIVAKPDEAVDVVARRFLQYKISGMPVVNEELKVLGIVTTDDLAKLVRGRRQGETR